MRILFTAASSFTGSWFIKALAAAGHEIVGTLQRKIGDYEGLRRERVEQVQALASLAPEVSFGSDSFLKLLKHSPPFDLLCHHAAELRNHKSPDFDAIGAIQNNARRLPEVITAFKQYGGKAILLTGTIYEPDEGHGSEPLRAFSAYGLSKGLTWQVFRYHCETAGIPLGKFVMPNPFGPWEDRGFTVYLMTEWKNGKTAEVRTPDYVRDNIHPDLLGGVYSKFAEQVIATPRGLIKANPSGYVESQGNFAKRVAREVAARTGWPCALEVMKQEDFSEPLARMNTEPATKKVPHWNESAAWDAFVQFYTRTTR